MQRVQLRGEQHRWGWRSITRKAPPRQREPIPSRVRPPRIQYVPQVHSHIFRYTVTCFSHGCAGNKECSRFSSPAAALAPAKQNLHASPPVLVRAKHCEQTGSLKIVSRGVRGRRAPNLRSGLHVLLDHSCIQVPLNFTPPHAPKTFEGAPFPVPSLPRVELRECCSFAESSLLAACWTACEEAAMPRGEPWAPSGFRPHKAQGAPSRGHRR